MTPEEREQLQYLCSRIQEEKDPIAFNGLVRELNDLLASLEPPTVKSSNK